MNLWVDFDLNFDPILQGENGQNKPENQQNWNMAKIAPKSDCFWTAKNGTLSGQIEVFRPLL